MISLIGDKQTWSVSWLKLLISLDLNILGNIWDNEYKYTRQQNI